VSVYPSTMCLCIQVPCVCISRCHVSVYPSTMCPYIQVPCVCISRYHVSVYPSTMCQYIQVPCVCIPFLLFDADSTVCASGIWSRGSDPHPKMHLSKRWHRCVCMYEWLCDGLYCVTFMCDIKCVLVRDHSMICLFIQGLHGCMPAWRIWVQCCGAAGTSSLSSHALYTIINVSHATYTIYIPFTLCIIISLTFYNICRSHTLYIINVSHLACLFVCLILLFCLAKGSHNCLLNSSVF